MKVSNMESAKGNPVPNQYIVNTTENHYINGERWDREITYFQSYQSIIAQYYYTCGSKIVHLDSKYWDYSRTTGKYRNQFLGETKAETQKKIDSGEYELVDLNQ